jgi:hypothetical protein
LISLPTWFVDVVEDPTQSSLTSRLVEQELAVEYHGLIMNGKARSGRCASQEQCNVTKHAA